jgi:hypothetical protein
MSEAAFERKVEEMIAARRSPVVDRLMHMSNAEIDASLEENKREREPKTPECACAPRGFISTPRAVKERLRAEHIAKGIHETFCPLYRHRRDYEPYDFGLRSHETEPPSYTLRQERQDEDVERVEYRRMRNGSPE